MAENVYVPAVGHNSLEDLLFATVSEKNTVGTGTMLTSWTECKAYSMQLKFQSGT